MYIELLDESISVVVVPNAVKGLLWKAESAATDVFCIVL